jgi:hypothetical protein
MRIVHFRSDVIYITVETVNLSINVKIEKNWNPTLCAKRQKGKCCRLGVTEPVHGQYVDESVHGVCTGYG